MAGLDHQACGVLALASAARCPDRALLSKHSNQNEKPDLGQESDAHDRDCKEHVLAERGSMNASHLAEGRECFGFKRRWREMRAAPASEAA